MISIKDVYDDINNPADLSKFMQKYIDYGYLSMNGTVHHYYDDDFNDKWYDNYMLESSLDVLNTGIGNCFDQVEFEREWFVNNGYEVKTIYEMVLLDYENPYPTHAFLVFKDENNKWNYFENADYDNRGIYTFSNFNKLINYQYNKYVELLKKYDITPNELKKIIITEYEKPRVHSTAEEFINYVVDSKKINLKNVLE